MKDTQSQKGLLALREGSIDELIKKAPCALDSSDPDVIEVGEYYLPRSTGIEIECDLQEDVGSDFLKSVPNIIHSWATRNEEVKFRIPPGIKGLQALYIISTRLKENCLLNNLSGAHYHVDFTDFFDAVEQAFDCNNLLQDKFLDKGFSFSSKRYVAIHAYVKSLLVKDQDFIFSELETWDYKGTYNTKQIGRKGDWVAIRQNLKTLEYRIGEMTFDYSLLFKRATHVNHITRTLYNNHIDTVKRDGNLADQYLTKDKDLRKFLSNRVNKI